MDSGAPVKEPSLASKVVVLDAGHGGIDSGTVGASGMREKDLVLDEVKRLASVLERRGYVVHLTRDRDVYIPLDGRVNIARDHRADLFISLHADSNPRPDVYGASVYTLSEAGSDREAAELARKENQSDVVAGVDLSAQSSPVASILIGLAQRDTINRSVKFAEMLVGQLGRVTDTLPREPHRSAAFVVLKAPDVPAVLIELGYLTSPRDCAQMGTEQWRNDVSLAIADAVDRQLRPGTGSLKAADAMR
jgi:N-acetylmuramoyl-L-alanine amidase